MQTLKLPFGQATPVFGMSTWQIGEQTRSQGEIDALYHTPVKPTRPSTT